MKQAIRRVTPEGVLHQAHKYRRLGPAKYLEYTRLELRARRQIQPRAGQPLDVGGARPIVPDAATIPAIRSHWVTYGHAIKELDAFKRVAGEHQVFLDVGAAEGIYAAVFCALTGGEAWAFEPSPTMHGRLERLCLANPDLAIKPFDLALGREPGTQTVSLYPDGQFGAASGGSHQMTIGTLDQFADEHAFAPTFAKIDVEGMELDVLAGGERTFRDHVRDFLLEVHYSMLTGGRTIRDVQRAVKDLGFALFDLELRPIADLERYAEVEPEVIPGYTIIVCRRA